MNEMTPLLAGRWSPRGFDRTHVVGSGQIECMLQAARWAPSAMNRQPWAFVVGRRGDRVHERLEGLARGLSDWALGASRSSWPPTAPRATSPTTPSTTWAERWRT